MNIQSYSREAINKGLQEAKSRHGSSDETVRILFSPHHISSENIDEVFEIYSSLEPDDFDTVVIVESHEGSANKKLPMTSHKLFSTPFGDVSVNDKLRNDFCDEDDDFFIDDDAFDDNVSFYDQLMLLQCSLDDFSVLSIQITDENSFIVKELAYALEEILASHNALIVFCCDLDGEHTGEFDKITSFYENESLSGLMNYLNSGESSIRGVGTFVAGLLVARKWGLKLTFPERNGSAPQNLLTGMARMQQQPILG